MKNHIALAALIVLAGSLTLQATAKQDRHERREAVKELRTSFRTWFARDVAPTLRDLQGSYDASLTPEQLATVLRLRARSAAERQQFRAEIQAIRASKIDAETQRERMRDARERMHDRRHAIMSELRPLMKATKDRLMTLRAQEEQTFDRWRKEARSIMESWKETHPDIRRGGHRPMKPFPLFDDDRKRQAAAFVLWDGSIPDDDAEDQGNRIRPTEQQRESHAAQSDQGTVYRMVEVFDMNGSRLNAVQLQTGQTPPSNGSLLASLPSGTYMVSTIDANGARHTTLVQHTR